MFLIQKKHSNNYADVLLSKEVPSAIVLYKETPHNKLNGYINRSDLTLIHVPYSTTTDKKTPP